MFRLKDFIKNVQTSKILEYNYNNICSFSYNIENNVLSAQKNINHYQQNHRIKNIIAIGTSAGGPEALRKVIPLIPKGLPAAYLIVQHMPPNFTKFLAQSLNKLSDITVKEAEDGETLMEGVAYVAPGGYHMTIKRNRQNERLTIRLSDMPSINKLKPSADILFNSLAETDLDNLVGVIMTGMGYDGCQGLINMKERTNAYIIAQSKASSTVFGMPKAVINAGIADRIVDVKEITNEIIKFMGVDRNGYEPVH